MRYILCLLVSVMMATGSAHGTQLGYLECKHNEYQAICLGSTSPFIMEGRGISIFPQLTNNEDCLKLARNSITKFPDKLDQYLPVTSLDLADNKISKLPDDLHRLSNLEILDVSRNKLTELSSSTQFPVSLRGLLLAGNRMKTIPAGVRIPGLFVLDLSDNIFTEIPTSFCVSDELIRVDFTKNKLTQDLSPHIDAISSCSNKNDIPFCMFTDIQSLDCNCPNMRPMFNGDAVFNLGLPSDSLEWQVMKCDNTKSRDLWKTNDLFDVNATEVRDTCNWARLSSNNLATPVGPGWTVLVLSVSFVHAYNKI